MTNEKDNTQIWTIVGGVAILALIMIYSGISTSNRIGDRIGELGSMDIDEEALAEAIVRGLGMVEQPEVPESSVPEEESNSSDESSSEETSDIWIERALEQILDEFEKDDEFYTCKNHEFDEDELSLDLEDSSVKESKQGDITVTATWEFEFSDDSDKRDCRVDRQFEVFWDDNDVDDEDWNEAEVTWIKEDLTVA